MRLCKITSSVKGCTLIKSRAEEGDQDSQFANREMLAQEQAVVDQNIAVAYLEYLSGTDNTTPEQTNFKN